MLKNGLYVLYKSISFIELQLNYSDINIILFGNKKDLYEINPKSPTAVKAGVISKFVEQRGILYE
jgi:hypothetical protein